MSMPVRSIQPVVASMRGVGLRRSDPPIPLWDRGIGEPSGQEDRWLLK